MSFAGAVGGVLGTVFAVVVITGAVSECAKRPEGVDKTEALGSGALEAAKDAAVGIGKKTEQIITGPEFQDGVRKAAKGGFKFAEETTKSVLKGLTQAMDESNEEQRRRKQENTPGGP
jgi:hypothetical protein